MASAALIEMPESYQSDESTDIPSPPIVVSDGAMIKLRALMTEAGPDRLYLRIWVGGGGCAGFQYGFCFEGSAVEDDRLIEKDGVKMVIDPLSLPYLAGVEIDYRDDIKGARFVIKNPNARTICGCGNSFAP
ncbi:MAG TPA: iron-sulfur cluster insertion protein ErpA [Acidiferrobacter sp.]|nr:iron-sulfur cluster insertion protein ErpA [Acidiferrobacter sp.]